MSASEDESWGGMNSDQWQWVYQWYPGAFFHLVHDCTGAYTLQQIAQKAADRNAMQMFSTNQPFPSEWNHAPPSTYFNPQGAGIGVTWGNWGPEPAPTTGRNLRSVRRVFRVADRTLAGRETIS